MAVNLQDFYLIKRLFDKSLMKKVKKFQQILFCVMAVDGGRHDVGFAGAIHKADA